jgi:hypothetical protein
MANGSTRPWTAAQEHDLRLLWPIADVSKETIACKVGRTVKALNAKAKAIGVHRPRPRSPVPFWRDNPDRIVLALELIRQGNSFSFVASRIGCTKNALIGRVHRSREYAGRRIFLGMSSLEGRLAAYPVPQGCRHITGDVRDGPGRYRFCDAPIAVVGASYCPEHMKLCHQKAGQMHPELRDALKWRWR